MTHYNNIDTSLLNKLTVLFLLIRKLVNRTLIRWSSCHSPANTIYILALYCKAKYIFSYIILYLDTITNILLHGLTCICHLRGPPDRTSDRRWAGSSCYWVPLVSRPVQCSWGNGVGSLGCGPSPLQTLWWSSPDGNLALLSHKSDCVLRFAYITAVLLVQM